MSKKIAPVGSNPDLDLLKAELESHDDSIFEHLSAHLMSRLLGDIAIAVSKSGHQVGADAGTAGLRGRRLRIECKRYMESSSLRSRELAGEIAEAATEDELLEAWVLMATKQVKENERKLALKQGQERGIAVIVIDWTTPAAGAGICALASLCATWPEVIEQHLGKKAADAARALASLVGSAVDNLRKDLEVWNLGFKNVRAASHKHLKSMWQDRRESRAHLGQDAAGGAPDVHLISRSAPLAQLDAWWSAPGMLEAPVVVTGLEGVGKTWVAFDWVRQHLDDLPIAILLPSGTFVKQYDVSAAGIQDLIARLLKESTSSTLSGVYWKTRVARLLKRPVTEGPAFLIVVDGVNQHPQTNWTGLAQTLQGNELVGRVRLLITCRQTFFEQDLRKFAKTDPRPIQVPVHIYDDSEFEEVLRLHGMNQDQLHESLKRHARTPRLFRLIYRLKDNAALKSDTTIHRLLFEYGREVLDNAFTPDEWTQWLADRAKHHRDCFRQTGALVKPEPMNDIGTSVASPAITVENVQRRLSELVDGHFYERKQIGVTTHVVLRKEAAVLGLALALLETMDNRGDDYAAQHSALEEWLEPIGTIDQSTDVLRAALSIISAGAASDGEVKTDCVLVTWMTAQNPGKTYEQDVALFGVSLPRSMLAVIERSGSHAHRATQHLAIQSLRKLPLARKEDWQFIEQRLVGWAAQFDVPHPEKIADPSHYAKSQRDGIVERIGTAAPGDKLVLGVRLRMAYQNAGDSASAIPGILEGHDLTKFPRVFQTAAVREAVQVVGLGKSWTGLHWLVSVGSDDEEKTREFIRRLAEEMLKVNPEAGVHDRLRNRAAALLFRLPGDPTLEKRASEIDEFVRSSRDFYKDYESDPGHSHFVPERRHVEQILSTTDVPVWKRLERTESFLTDPTVTLPEDVRQAVVGSLETQVFDQIHSGMNRTREEYAWEKVQLAAARFAPVEFTTAVRRELAALATRRGEQKYWSALHLSDLLLIAQPEDVPALRGLRTGSKLASHEEVVNTFCLQIEILHMPVEQQLQNLLYASDYHATTDLLSVVRTANALQLGQFLDQHHASTRAERIVLEVMATQRIPTSEALVQRLLHTLESDSEELRNIAFMALSLSAPEVCGERLLSSNWKADAGDAFASHYGSGALAAASKSFAFEDVLPLVAPWRWLDAAMVRGGQENELAAASAALIQVVLGAAGDIGEPPGELSMRSARQRGLPTISVARPSSGEDPLRETLRSMSEGADAANKRMEELSRAAAASIRKIRASGYAFYLQSFDVPAVRAAHASSPNEWSKLLDGALEGSAAFKTRVRAAEGLYMTYCEVLLEVDPSRGVELWKSLTEVVRTKITGLAGIPEFVHMVFRAPSSPDVDQLRSVLASFAFTSTDKAVFDLTIAAQANGHDAWLHALLHQDSASRHQWRRMRGVMLDAFHSYPALSALNWPSGRKASSIERLESEMAKWKNRGCISRYWWTKFVQASDSAAAFAAWTVFLACADRRAYVWMAQELEAASKNSELDRLRELHFRLNYGTLDRKLSAHEDQGTALKNHLFGRDAPAHWLVMDSTLG